MDILFRGKTRLDSKDWVYGTYHYSEGHSYILSREKFIELEGRQTLHEKEVVEVIGSTVGQYTGVDDEKGERIFDGDLVDNSALRWRVRFDRGCFCGDPFLGELEQKGELKSLLIALRAIQGARKIGNVFDNPELIKQIR